MGRETLKRTVDLAQTSIGLEVIYGDTDSIMINTGITDKNEYGKVLELGNKVKREVNKLYKTLELEIDGVFSSMLLLKKKKYAAVTFSVGPDGKAIKGKETKGLDLVRRDWCIQSKESGTYVLDQILSGEEKEIVINNIHEHLEGVAQKMRSGELPLEKYVITKGLNKHPNDYPDAKSLPHVFVAKKMLSDHRAVSIGDHIPYVITKEEQTAEPTNKKSLAAERARHPEDITRSNGELQPDVEWYLTQQILPPISRLCEPIEELTQSALAGKLGLDSSKYNHIVNTNVDEDDLVDYTPASCLSDEERFKDVQKLFLSCSSCNETSEFAGIVRVTKENGVTIFKSGMCCPNPQCNANNWGEPDMMSCMAKISNKMKLLKKQQQQEYYDGIVRCDDPMCGLETRQLSVYEGCCLKPHCNGRMKSVYTESTLQTQLKYFDSLFDIDHACKQLLKADAFLTEKEIMRNVQDKDAFQILHMLSLKSLEKNAFNWVDLNTFCQPLFGTH
jgi:DNA polymerase alpha subunit A